jgi:hypothetical protein
VRDLILSDEYVTLYHTLFLHAIEWYREKVTHENWSAKWSIDEVSLSLLPYLKMEIQNGRAVEGALATLLLTMVKEYWNFLEAFAKEPWADKEAVERELGELDSIALDGLLKIRSASR